jgi:hypothetical protein
MKPTPNCAMPVSPVRPLDRTPASQQIFRLGGRGMQNFGSKTSLYSEQFSRGSLSEPPRQRNIVTPVTERGLSTVPGHRKENGPDRAALNRRSTR